MLVLNCIVFQSLSPNSKTKNKTKNEPRRQRPRHATTNNLRDAYSKDVRLPVQLQRAMAAEAEAAREARAKVIAAEGEQKASKALREASEVIGGSPAALQLRYLQVRSEISEICKTYDNGK